MKKTGILYDNISGNTGDVAIGISLKKILRNLNIEFDELIPGNFNPLDYDTIIIGGGYLLRESPDFFYDKFRVPGNHILNAIGIYGEPKDLDYLKSYKFISVRSSGDKKKLAYLNEEIHVIPCTTMLLEDLPVIPFTFKKPSIGIHIFPMLSKDEEREFIHWVSSLPFSVYFIPITHYNRDIQYMRYLHEQIPNSEILPILKAQEIFTICGKFNYFISCSLHGAIFSYVHNVPFILFNSQDKMQFFMEDRQLDRYLFKNFEELRQGFEELVRCNPDYSTKIIDDKKILTGYVNYLSSVLAVNKSQQTITNESSSESIYQITYLLSDISELERKNAINNTRIAGLTSHTNNLEAVISDCRQQISEVANYSSSLEAVISDNKKQISELSEQTSSLKAVITERENQISELLKQTSSLEAVISEHGKLLSEVTPYARHLEQEISMKNRHIIDLTNQNYTWKQENNSIKMSVTYQLTRKFDRVILERCFPPDSRRRKFYDRGLKLGRILINDGWKEGVRAVKKYRADKGGKKEEPKPYAQVDIKKSAVNGSTEPNNNLNAFLSVTDNRLIFPRHTTPLVSIIILTYNKSSYTYQCLESILKYSNIPYELIIVDNGSTDNTSELLKRIDHSILILNTNNLGFIRGCNEGAKKAAGKFVLFLNNDTVVTENWLSCLVRTIETYPQCGAVGCRLVWPNGKLQEAGSIIWRDGSASGYGRDDNPAKPEYSYVREVDFCSGACLLVRRELFSRLDGFDERYIPAYYEDADLCIGIQGMGYATVYQPDVTIFHHEFTSSSKDLAQSAMKTNQIKFVEKWRGILTHKENPDPLNIMKARDIRKNKTILFLDDRIPASNQGSGYPRSNIMLKILGDLGYKVTFFPLANFTPWQPYTHEFQQSGIEVFFGDDLDFEAFARQRSFYYDIVIVSRPHNFEKTCTIIKTFFPNAHLVYDAEALFSTREILKAKVEGTTLEDSEITNLRNKEFELMKKADLIITVSDNERKLIQKTGGINDIIVFSHPVPVRKTTNDYESRKDILFIGSFLAFNGPNDDAILFFVREIWPDVQRALQCKLYIVGTNPPDNILALASDSLIVTGFVQDIEKYYNNCRVFIVPHRYAAGIPLKLIEAMSYGIPSVVSELIAVQLNLNDGHEVLVAKNCDEFAKKIIRIYQNGTLWEKIQHNSIEYVQNNCNPETIKKNLDDALKSYGKK